MYRSSVTGLNLCIVSQDPLLGVISYRIVDRKYVQTPPINNLSCVGLNAS